MSEIQQTPTVSTKNTNKGGQETKYITFIKKHEAKAHFQDIKKSDICTKNTIYDTFQMKGYWSQIDNNVRLRKNGLGISKSDHSEVWILVF